MPALLFLFVCVCFLGFFCAHILFLLPQSGKNHKLRNKTFLTSLRNPIRSMFLLPFYISTVYNETFSCTNCFFWTIQADVLVVLHWISSELPFAKCTIAPKTQWLISYTLQGQLSHPLVSKAMFQTTVGLSLKKQFYDFFSVQDNSRGWICSMVTRSG